MALNFEALTGLLALDSSSWMAGIRQATSSAVQLGQRFSVVAHNIGVAAEQASLAVGAIGVAVSAGSLALVKLASNAEEAASKFGFVFKDAAENTGKALDDFAAKAGRSRYFLRDMAADIGALVGPMGFSAAETGRLSTEFAKLAVDLSSFFNVTESDALIALRAGIVGESEPLRRLGVQISEVAVQQEAFRLKLVKSKDEMTPMVKTQAIYSLIMKQTAQAQGDAIRTGGSWANMSRRVRDAAKDLATDIGNGLLPAFTETLRIFDGLIATVGVAKPQIVSFLNSNLSIARADDIWEGVFQVVERVAGAFTNLGPSAMQLAHGFDPIRERLQFVYERGKQLFDSMPAWAKDLLVVGATLGGISMSLGSFGMLLGPFGAVFGSLSGLLNPLRLIGMAASIVGPLLSSAFLPITPIIGAVVLAVYSAYDAISSNATAAAAWEHIKELAGELWDSLKSLAGMLTKEWATAWNDGSGAMGEFSRSIGTSLLVMLERAMIWLKQIGPYVGEFLVGAFNAAKEAVGALSATLEFASDIVMGNYAAAWLKLLKLVSKVLDALDYADRALGGSGIQIAKDVAELVKQIQAEADAAKKAKQDMADAALQTNDVEKKIFAEEVLRNRERAAQAQEILDKMRESGAAATGAGAMQAANLENIVGEAKRAEAAGVKKIYATRSRAAPEPTPAPPAAPKPSAGEENPAVLLTKDEHEGNLLPDGSIVNYDGETLVNERGERRPPSAKENQRRTAKALADIARNRELEAAAASKAAEQLATDKSQNKAPNAGLSRVARPGKLPATASGPGVAGHAAGHAAGLPGREAPAKPSGHEAAVNGMASTAVNAAKTVYDTTTGMAGDLDRLMDRSAVGISDVAVVTATQMSQQIQKAKDAGVKFTIDQLRSLQQAKMAATQSMLAIGNTMGEQRRQAIADAAEMQRAFEDAFDKITQRGKYAMENLAASEQRLARASKQTAQTVAAADRAARQQRLADGAGGQGGGGNGAQGGGQGGNNGNRQPPQPQAPSPLMTGSSAEARRNRIAANNASGGFGMGNMMGGIVNMANSMSSMYASALTGVGAAQGAFANMVAATKDPLQKFDLMIGDATAKLSAFAINRSGGPFLESAKKELADLRGRRQQEVNRERAAQHAAVSAAGKQFREQQIAQAEATKHSLREIANDMAGNLTVGQHRGSNGFNININGVNDIREAADRLDIEMRRRGYALGVKRSLEVRPTSR